MKIYLDDERYPPIGWIRTKNVNSTITLLKTGRVVSLSLDHDLGTNKECGYDVLLWIEEQVFTNKTYKLPNNIYIHTANPSARKKMDLALNKIKETYYEKKKKN